jgi:hypothetical protein
MTVNERIIQLNTEFQKLYYDNNFGFFKIIVPEKLLEIKVFIFSVIDDQHPLSNKIQELAEKIDYEMTEIKTLEKEEKPSFRLKDHYINTAKRNISELLWRFYYIIWNYDEKILNQAL